MPPIGSRFFTLHHSGESDNGDFAALVVSPLDDVYNVPGLVFAAKERVSAYE